MTSDLGSSEVSSDVANRPGKSRMKLSLLSTFEDWWLLFLELPTVLLSDFPSILRMYVSRYMDLVSHIQRYLPRRKEMLEHWVCGRKVFWKDDSLTLNILQGCLIRIELIGEKMWNVTGWELHYNLTWTIFRFLAGYFLSTSLSEPTSLYLPDETFWNILS